MTCFVCGKNFSPTKFHKSTQKYCGLECFSTQRKKYKDEYDRKWRREHFTYMRLKSADWRNNSEIKKFNITKAAIS